VLPDYSLKDIHTEVETICNKIRDIYDVQIELSTRQELQAPPPTDVNAPMVKALQTAISELRGIHILPSCIGVGTVAAFFRQAGFNAVVWATQDETLHEPNEYAKIENIIEDAKVFAHIALQT
jgi:succinyl-diaminopimelate desuccinylase